jgi:hypothetical protein
MILGMSTANFTLFHVVLSLIGIGSGFVVIFGMLSDKRLPGWTALFLVTTVATSVTGFFFPSTGLDPAQIVGIISLVVLAVALLARYSFHLTGSSRWIYVIAAVLAQWLNTFVAVVQSFQKIPFVHALAPTQKEPTFLIAQVSVVVILGVLAVLAVRRFHPPSASAA